MKFKGLKRKAIRVEAEDTSRSCVTPLKKWRGPTYSNSKDYKYFYGHLIPEIARKLSNKRVLCWKNDSVLSLPICAIHKFWEEKTYCKRCSLFQGDEHAQELKLHIDAWELDDLEEE